MSEQLSFESHQSPISDKDAVENPVRRSRRLSPEHVKQARFKIARQIGLVALVAVGIGATRAESSHSPAPNQAPSVTTFSDKLASPSEVTQSETKTPSEQQASQDQSSFLDQLLEPARQYEHDAQRVSSHKDIIETTDGVPLAGFDGPVDLDLTAPDELYKPPSPLDNLELARVVKPRGAGYFKSFMPYTAITNRGSRQYHLQHNPNVFTTPEGLRCYDCAGEALPLIALGTGITSRVGVVVEVTFVDAKQHEYTQYCVIGDIKADVDTDPSHTFHTIDGSVVEFVVDERLLKQRQPQVAWSGDVSDYRAEDFHFQGSVKSVKVFKQTVNDLTTP